MRALRTLLTLSLLFWTSACSLASVIPLTPTPTVFVYPTPTTPQIPSLTVDQLKNAQYTIIGSDTSAHAYQFANGEYKQGTDPGATDYADLKMLDQIAFGDLNDDGVPDAAVLIAENYGGSGVFVSVYVVLNDNGQPRQVASYLIDDRPQINSLSIVNGQIIVDALVHGPNDPMCCPTFPVKRTFQLVGPSLVLVRSSSQTPDGHERSIAIDAPQSGEGVSGALVIRGRVTIAPFENTLSLRVYSEQGNQLSSGPITVDAPDPGAPGTFTATLDLSSFPPGIIHIEISDLSAADGSVLALDSVDVVVR